MPSATTTWAAAVATETRWIEAESLHVGVVADNNNDDTSLLRRRAEQHGKDDDDIDATWTDLFADPDPYETFTYQWNITVDNPAVVVSTVGATTQLPAVVTPQQQHLTIDISVTGHKAENGQTLHSTGLTVWRASQILADWLVQCCDTSLSTPSSSSSCCPLSRLPRERPLLFSQYSTVLELGAGLGVPGLVCHWLGAPVVVLTDGDTDTLANLRRNVARNGRRPQQHATTAGPDNNNNDDDDDDTAARTPYISCRQLVWGNSEHINNVLHCLRSVVVVGTTADESRPDMESNNDQRYFDVILGSDIIYVEHVIEPLFDTVSQLLDKRSGVFLLAYCRRNVSISLVLSAAQQRGMVWHEPDAPDGVYQFWYPPPLGGGDSTR
jgi:predicted nicotinamide N-methyase